MNKAGFGAVLLALPVTAAGGLAALCGRTTVRASANSAPGYWDGMNGSGVVVSGGQFADGECPIEVQEEHLTFRIPELFEPGAGASDGSDVTAEYTFYNPTEEDITMTLFFPVGFAPEYLAGFPDDDVYAVTVSGERQNGIVKRYTYGGMRSYGSAFDVGSHLPSDTARSDSFFSADTPVTTYVYDVSVPAEDESYFRAFTCTFESNPSKTKVYISNGGAVDIRNGRGEAYASVQTGKTQKVTVYAFGDIPEIVSFGVYTNSGYAADAVEGADAVLAAEPETVTLKEFIDRTYDAARGIGERDWYNAFVDRLCDDSQPGAYIEPDRLADMLMLWYEYELTVPAHDTVVNAVTAPLLPSIYGGSNPRYCYEYLLSPAQKWSKYGKITIRVETPFFLSDSSLDFTKEDEAYVFERDSLPMGELAFTITEHEIVRAPYDPYDGVSPPLQTALILLACVVLGSLVIVAAVLCVKLRNRKKLAAHQMRLSQGSVCEGKIAPDECDGGKDE